MPNVIGPIISKWLRLTTRPVNPKNNYIYEHPAGLQIGDHELTTYLTNNGEPFATLAAIEAAYPGASNPRATSYFGTSWATAKPAEVAGGTWTERITLPLSESAVSALQAMPERVYTSVELLNAALPPETSPEGMTALAGPSGSRVEYILINSAWQVRAAIVIGA